MRHRTNLLLEERLLACDGNGNFLGRRLTQTLEWRFLRRFTMEGINLVEVSLL